MRLLSILVVSLLTVSVKCQVNEYFNALRSSQNTDFEFEQNYFMALKPDSLLVQLQSFHSDSNVIVRNKVYDIYYRRAMLLDINQRSEFIARLIEGCHDSDIKNQLYCVNHLKSFSRIEFDEAGRSYLSDLLINSRLSMDREFILLAGYLNFGYEQLSRRILMSDKYGALQLYWMHLALARMGEENSVEYCINLASGVNDQNSRVAYILPQLIYTRQRKAIDYCIQMLYSEDKLCVSPDPDKSEKVCCGYRIMELLAPVIIGFPYQIDNSGTLKTSDYKKALINVREWLNVNSEYQISTASY